MFVLKWVKLKGKRRLDGVVLSGASFKPGRAGQISILHAVIVNVSQKSGGISLKYTEKSR